MTNAAIRDNLIARLDKLPYDLQLRVLDFASALMPKGITGKSLVKFEGAIPAEDLKLMSAAIEEGCEKVDICLIQILLSLFLRKTLKFMHVS